MNKIVILYYSGVGNTKTIAQYMYNYLKQNHNVDMYSIEELSTEFSFDKYSKAIIGFPTIHTEPAVPMTHFIQQLGKSKKPLPTFVYTTCGLYSGNAIRIFCKSAIAKNIVPIYTSSYRSPAIDGILLTPKIKRWYAYEKGISLRIKVDLENFLSITGVRSKIPRLKWYSALNYPNKMIGKYTKFQIYLHESKCIKCGVCIENCAVGAYVKGDNHLPILNARKCVNCYRCIHHCPKRALSLSKRKAPEKTIKNSREVLKERDK